MMPSARCALPATFAACAFLAAILTGLPDGSPTGLPPDTRAGLLAQESATPPAEALAEAAVGMPHRVEQLVIPGGELEALPIVTPEQPLVLRIVAVYPHGSDFRYDLEFYGLEPGRYNLLEYLRRRDGAALGDVPPVWVEVRSSLPPGQILPNAPPREDSPRPSNYRIWAALAVVAWGVGLWLILTLRRHEGSDSAESPRQRPRSWADQLRPLVEQARQGQLKSREAAELERSLIGYWRQKLGLAHLPPHEAMQRLRSHPEAGPLLVQLERWLHHPEPDVPADLDGLLRPYERIASEPMDSVAVATPLRSATSAGEGASG